MTFRERRNLDVRDVRAGFEDWVGIDRLTSWREWGVASSAWAVAFVNLD
jgi:hypothetical protein